jgi:hypothetical protein
MLKTSLGVVAAIGAFIVAPQAANAVTMSKPAAPTFTACSMADIGLTSGSCVGWVSGNLLGGSPAMNAASASNLNTLLNVQTFNASTLSSAEKLGSLSGNTIEFTDKLYGTTVLGIHAGAARGAATGIGYQATAFYTFDAGTTGLDVLSFNRAGLSSATLYSTGVVPAVPETATWVMMMIGFGVLGFAIRRRTKTAPRLQTA